ncbi:MAG: hypothetical protein FD148_3552, partial [Methylocystaceae bacterium]
MRPGERLSRPVDLRRAERRSVAAFLALLGRRAIADQRAAADERRPGIGLRRGDRLRNRLGIVAVDMGDMPAGGGETCDLVHRGRKARRPVDGDRIVVPEEDELRELQMPGEVDRLMADAFHQAAVARDHIGEMIDEIVAEARRREALGDRHADRGREPLAEGTGGRLDAGGVTIFGMARRRRTELAEIFELLAAHARIAEQVEQRVKQHRPVAGRQHETVAVRPVRPSGVKLHEALEQHGRDVGHAHRHAGMAGFRLFDRVHRQGANGVGVARRIGFCVRRRNFLGRRQYSVVHVTPFLRLTSSRILGVRISCIARSSLLP